MTLPQGRAEVPDLAGAGAEHRAMSRFRIALVAAGIAAASAVATPAHAAGCAGAALKPTPSNAAQISQATLCLLNAQRGAHGVQPLSPDQRLARAATSYAHEMASRKFFSHTSPSGSTPLTRIKSTRYLSGARKWQIGENLAWGTGPRATPRLTVSAWMHSPGHRRNILDPVFDHIGIGVAPGAPVQVGGAAGGATYATDFGSR
jgi:uncharacterized protein YkwD